MSSARKLLIVFGLMLILSFEIDAYGWKKPAATTTATNGHKKVAPAPATTPKAKVATTPKAKVNGKNACQPSAPAKCAPCLCAAEKSQISHCTTKKAKCEEHLRSNITEVEKYTKEVKAANVGIYNLKIKLDRCNEELSSAIRELVKKPVHVSVADCKKEKKLALDEKYKCALQRAELEQKLKYGYACPARNGAKSTFAIPIWATVVAAGLLHLVLVRVQLAVYKPHGLGKKMKQVKEGSEEEED